MLPHAYVMPVSYENLIEILHWFMFVWHNNHAYTLWPTHFELLLSAMMHYWCGCQRLSNSRGLSWNDVVQSRNSLSGVEVDAQEVQGALEQVFFFSSEGRQLGAGTLLQGVGVITCSQQQQQQQQRKVIYNQWATYGNVPAAAAPLLANLHT